MAVKQVPYDFEDGRKGYYTKSDKFYKTIEVEEPIETENENGEKIIEFKKVPKDIYYKIRKVGTNEIYDDAIDVIKYDYEEVNEAEMEAEYDCNK